MVDKKGLVVETSLDLIYILPYYFYLVHVIHYFYLTKINLSINFYSISQPNSFHTEKQGLIDGSESIEKNGLVIEALTTDMHVQIQSYTKKCCLDIKYQFNVQHG